MTQNNYCVGDSFLFFIHVLFFNQFQFFFWSFSKLNQTLIYLFCFSFSTSHYLGTKNDSVGDWLLFDFYFLSFDFIFVFILLLCTRCLFFWPIGHYGIHTHTHTWIFELYCMNKYGKEITGEFCNINNNNDDDNIETQTKYERK